MKLFTTKITKFLLLFILLNLSIFFILRQVYFSSRIPVLKREIINNNINKNDSISILLGSSHVFYGVNSNLLGNNFYNLSSISQGFHEDYSILNALVNENYKIKKVVFSISLFSNGWDISKTNVEGERLRRFDYEHAYDTKYSSDPQKKDWAALVSEISRTLFSSNSDLSKIDPSGNYISQCLNDGSEITDAEQAFSRHSIDMNFSVFNPFLDSIIDFCSKKSINLILIATPVSKAYRDLCDKTDYSKFLERLDLKLKTKSFNFIDSRDYFRIESESVMFKDADHLSPCGQEAFSNYLSSQLGSSANF